ncbi:MAG: hypothetical protein V1744_04035 [Candidatus Altiarchaeota archaeon]
MLCLLVVKLVVAVFAVVLLSLVAELVSPKAAGVLSGYPIGSAITLFFYGLEVGPDFAADSSVYNILGLVATQSFIYLYWRSSRRFNIVVSSLIAIAGYFAVVWPLHLIDVGRLIAAAITICSIVVFTRLFKGVEDVKIGGRIRLGFSVLLARALFAAFMIVSITSVAAAVGPSWAGLFSSFPTTIFPLIMIVHLTYGKERAHTVIKNVPGGLISVVLYSLVVSVAYPAVGVYLGTALAFALATAYLLVVLKRS